jgi:plasmid stabilization system protein ParE
MPRDPRVLHPGPVPVPGNPCQARRWDRALPRVLERLRRGPTHGQTRRRRIAGLDDARLGAHRDEDRQSRGGCDMS